MNRIASNKDMRILELQGKVSGITLQLQQKVPTNTENKINLCRFKGIIADDDLSKLEQIDKSKFYDRSFIRFLVQALVPEVKYFPFTLSQLKRYKSAEYCNLENIFSERIIGCGLSDDELSSRLLRSRISELVSHVLHRLGQSILASPVDDLQNDDLM